LSLLVGAAMAALSAMPTAQDARALAAQDPIGELILLSSDEADRLVVLFEEGRAVLTEASRIRLREFAERLRETTAQLRRVLVVGTTIPTGDEAADQDLAIRRGLTARDELIRASGLPASLFLVQASRSLSGWKSTGRVVVEFEEEAGARRAHSARVRTAWDTATQRWLLVCGDGTVLPVRISAPDDFSAAGACPGADRPAAAPGATARAVAQWESRTARWVLRCPDGSPLTGQSRDPDDFHALARCRP
jgi:hypothetical protein